MENEKKNNESHQDCWRRIGIWGNESARCEKLEFVKHCRNCEVFEQGARVSMLERRNKSDSTEQSIEELIKKELLAGDLSIMPFRIGNKCFAIPTSQVITISDQVAIHSIPYNTNPKIRGLVAINHEVYTFISMAKLLNHGPRKLNANIKKLHSLFKRTLVVNFSGRNVAFHTDEVYPIHRYFISHVEKSETTDDSLQISTGMIKNEGSWCDNCQILNLELLSKELEATV